MSQGYITNNAAQTLITTVFAVGQAIPLTTGTAVGSRSRPIPGGTYLSHLSLVMSETGATTAQVEAFLCWDAQGDELAFGPTGLVNVTSGLTTAARRMVSIKVDAVVTAPETQDADQTLYLFLRTDAGTVTLPAGGAKLHWAQGPNRP
jgi:hypothetical protein